MNRESAEKAAMEIAKEYGLEPEYSNRIPMADIIERSCGQDELERCAEIADRRAEQSNYEQAAAMARLIAKDIRGLREGGQ